MMRKRLAALLFGGTFFAALSCAAVAFAAEGTLSEGSDAWQTRVARAIAAGLAMGLSALGAGYAQSKIGSAGAGTLAERPEVAIWIITLQALPEIIVLLGFVSAIMINTAS